MPPSFPTSPSPSSWPTRSPRSIRRGCRRRCARKCEDLLIDVVGLCVTARNEDYVAAALAGWDDDGPCTAIGHARTMSAAGAAFVNGTAAHGEDFDDTFEGGPVHAGAVIVPAVLAACERHEPRRPSALARHRGRRRDHVPAEPGGAEGGPQGRLPSRPRCSAPWRRRPASAPRCARRSGSSSMRSASPARWRAASSSISPKAPGPSGMHPGWAAQSGLRAALLGARGLRRPAHRVRGRARPVPRLRPHAPRATTTRSPAISASAG